MASAAFNQTLVGTAPTVIFDQAADGGFATEFFIGVRASSSNPALISIPSLHKPNEFVGVPIGASITFKLGQTGLGKVLAQGEGGDTIVDFGVISKAWHI